MFRLDRSVRWKSTKTRFHYRLIKNKNSEYAVKIDNNNNNDINGNMIERTRENVQNR